MDLEWRMSRCRGVSVLRGWKLGGGGTGGRLERILLYRGFIVELQSRSVHSIGAFNIFNGGGGDMI